jgi:hypothetical protein
MGEVSILIKIEHSSPSDLKKDQYLKRNEIHTYFVDSTSFGCALMNLYISFYRALQFYSLTGGTAEPEAKK